MTILLRSSALALVLSLVEASSGLHASISRPNASAAHHGHGARLPRIAANDNRRPAGALHDGVLALRLVATVGMWYPDGDDRPGVAMQTFAEEGRGPSIPGPLLRVRAGSEVVITVRNTIAGGPLVVHGLVSHTTRTRAADDSLVVAAGTTREVRIHLDVPGTYYYWGATTGRSLEDRTNEDSQLSGAIVVDPPNAPPPADRIFMLGVWTDTAGRYGLVRSRMLAVINGRTWPHTERLYETVGDTAHWRVINSSADSHPMHLHGFYFRVDSHGDALGDSTFTGDHRLNAVTDLLAPGQTMIMTWSPSRAGNWLFHCHLPEHFAVRGSLGTPPSPMQMHAHAGMNHALDGMSGLVMGVVVRPKPGAAAAPSVLQASRRTVRLVINASGDKSASFPKFFFTLQNGGDTSTTGTASTSAPPLVLTRGEPARITVVNTLAEPSAVHWHGIELESYYDGVAGFSGTTQHLSPVIAPGDSFVALFTPPRAGTFIYHTHIDEERQQPAGLAGPIIVLEPGARFDPAHDVSVVATSLPDSGGIAPFALKLNGSLRPPPLELQAGVHYRLRLINMTLHAPMARISILRNDSLAAWRSLARDGADLPTSLQLLGPARAAVTIGGTADMDFVAEQPGELRLEMRAFAGRLLATMPIHVRAAP